MQEKEQNQYLRYKNIPLSPKTKYHSPKVYANKNMYTSPGQKLKSPTQQQRSHIKSKGKQVIISDSNIECNASNKFQQNKCDLISFSTESTKKQKPTQYTQQNQSKIRDNAKVITRPIQSPIENRLKKAKSDINIMTNCENRRLVKNASKDLIQQILQSNPQHLKGTHKLQINIQEVSSLVEAVKVYEAQIKRLQKQIQLKDAKIRQLQKANNQKLKAECKAESYLAPQNKYNHEQNRANVRRLLKMLQMTQQFKDFATFGIQDGGLTLLSQANKVHRTKFDLASMSSNHSKQKKVHHCQCQSQFIPQQYLWVPQSIYQHGKQFINTHVQSQLANNLSKSQLQLLLYQLNRMWRERQKRIINTIRQEKNFQIQKLKRRYNVRQNQQSSGRTTRKNSRCI